MIAPGALGSAVPHPLYVFRQFSAGAEKRKRAIMQKLVVGAAVVGAALGRGVVANAASAGPAALPESTHVRGRRCLGLVGQQDALITHFTVVGNGNGIAHRDGIFLNCLRRK